VTRVLPAFSRPATLKNTSKVDVENAFNQWLLKGEIAIPDVGFDPATQISETILNQEQVIYRATLPPGNFIKGGKATRPKWLFKLKRKTPDIVGAPGWRAGKFSSLPAGGTGQGNRIRYRFKGNGTPISVASGQNPTRMRETIRVGDTCYTAVLTCYEPNLTTLRCYSKTIVPP
jgi:hypothetical protein